MKKLLTKILKKFNYDLVRLNREIKFPPDFDEFHKRVIKKVLPYTMTSPERLFGLIESVKYVINNQVEGSIVECGVWKGGSMLAVAETLLSLGKQDRTLYLYDTFEGMSEPSEKDVTFSGEEAKILLDVNKKKEENPVWAYSALDTVKQTMLLSAYDQNKIKYIKGKVEVTIPSNIPDKIAVLRLDTDWYESTKHELIHLFPRLVKGGVLIIDDFGHWEGAKKAVIEYFKNNRIAILLNRLDETGRIAIKQ